MKVLSIGAATALLLSVGLGGCMGGMHSMQAPGEMQGGMTSGAMAGAQAPNCPQSGQTAPDAQQTPPSETAPAGHGDGQATGNAQCPPDQAHQHGADQPQPN